MAQKITKNQLADQEAWITPTYTSGWADYDAGATDAWGGARYMKDSMGFVHLKGLVKNVSGATKAAGSTVFQLPVGYRPGTFRLRHATMVYSGVSQLDVSATGSVIVGNSIVNGEWASLSGISFKAEA